MSVLGDTSLARIWPDSPFIGPASIDLHLGDELNVWPRWIRRDPRIDQSDKWRAVSLQLAWTPESGEHDPLEEPAWVLEPNTRYLATTKERIRIPSDCAGQLSARSSWGRDGLAVICGPAGWCDPEFEGYLVLELSVIGSEIVIWPGAGCLQLVVHRLEEAVARGYRGKYQQQPGIVPSRTHVEVRR